MAFVLRSFRSKALRDLFVADDARGIRPDLVERVRARLQALHRAKAIDDLRVPGWRLHALHTKPARHAVATARRSVSISSNIVEDRRCPANTR